MSTAPASARRIVEQACAQAGLRAEAVEAIRLAENEIWRLPQQQVVVRVVQSGQSDAAQREVRVARWLAENGISAVRPLDVPQPVEVDGRPVTFWDEIGPHEHGSAVDIAHLLRRLHALEPPDLALGHLDPFARITERLDVATTLEEADRRWLEDWHAELVAVWAELPRRTADCAVHGDAWPANLVYVLERGPLMMDLERFSVGPPEWDLTSTAVRAKTTGVVSAAEYDTFCAEYGYDVTDWVGYEILAGARELRMVTYAAQHAARHQEWAAQAQYRVDCLRGRHGSRPWHWRGIL